MCFLLLFASFAARANGTRFAISWLCYRVAGFAVRWVFHSCTNTPLVSESDSLTTWHRLFFRCYSSYSLTNVPSSAIVFCWSAQLAFSPHCLDHVFVWAQEAEILEHWTYSILLLVWVMGTFMRFTYQDWNMLASLAEKFLACRKQRREKPVHS